MTSAITRPTFAATDSTAPASAGLPELSGVLFFPVTCFDDGDRIDEEALTRHIDGGAGAGAGAVFVACGTGEFHALSVEEHRRVVEIGVAVTASRVPVVAGVGGPLGHALQCVRQAEEAGADALLVLPPYLVQGPPSGTERYITAIADASSLPVIAYHRGPSRLTLDSVRRLIDIPNLAGIKDGVGDVAVMQQFVNEARSRRPEMLFFNGLLTAEASQAAYRAIGVPMYSSAAFAMAPDIATAFYGAYHRGDDDAQRRLLDGFYTPLVQLRDEVPGFAVALIKAGVVLGGTAAGSVRPPLVDPSPEQRERLAALLDDGRRLAAELAE
ncbi:5-dehydro-4-deoxyglucarate dehydratase [Phytoactinopolyspora mesophila]|uniref:Probable 5-dehydro-4-deoxyglucarate dehydratase n=1 Tax=Phytoactinopolyspora mesophila TaxID=2650750 RepID=A0A7K3LZR9_9ACTN|nr:5-dehydro-4-deoxyglucarate dehydratase [Phytoactinopolyspora mesophila]NDL56526.1 5-dehydro-4-deoxyglucarate dehydratase [Phytoactinopolyspora mesophila]